LIVVENPWIEEQSKLEKIKKKENIVDTGTTCAVMIFAFRLLMPMHSRTVGVAM
jgi:hypothetical protein